ncbi:MAG: membrane protein insertion efficiency factor YidD [Alphaproteobacteria bacterium]|nr:membrane protein insertion efficiency factor YidD [Alphaproteobacteria bacterium]
MKSVSRMIVLILKLPIWFWQWCIAPVLGANCRYEPSCSRYASEALSTHGPFQGGWLALKRIVSCNPWGGAGFDPVPGTCGHTSHQHLDNEHGVSVSHSGT